MILDDIAAATKKRIEAKKRLRSAAQVEKAAVQSLCTIASTLPCLPLLPDTISQDMRTGGNPFELALSVPGLSFICEVKRASPSKGLIAPDFPYLQIAKEYEKAGAAAISVLTEPDFFKGNDEYLREIACTVTVPVLRKDFILDIYQIYEAKLLGASAVLLICGLLDGKTLYNFIRTTYSLSMAAIVEAHDESEIGMALDSGARIVGVNNRDLKTFDVDIGLSLKLRSLVPDNVIFIAESGIKSAENVRTLEDGGVDAVLIGEALMRSPDKRSYLNALRQR
ncbi:MAG: indole-3-glycerol phosphate synthase TrpC [Treponema sp.]|jgi:indole-3-glycerol phosphate synthase|nr:indole-3-glycerol phosphate synthase TrpC [Treponema sp.]